MMSILFKGVEMPKGCWDCPFQTNPICATNDIINFTTRIARPDNCPLIEVQDDVQPVVYGEWNDISKAVYVKGLPYTSAYQCNQCRYISHGKWTHFCPNCGARMVGET